MTEKPTDLAAEWITNMRACVHSSDGLDYCGDCGVRWDIIAHDATMRLAALTAALSAQGAQDDRAEPILGKDLDMAEPMRRDLARLLDNLYGLHLRPGHLDAVLEVVQLHAPVKVPLSAQGAREALLIADRNHAIERQVALEIELYEAKRQIPQASAQGSPQATANEVAMARGFIALWEAAGIQDADEWLCVLRSRAELVVGPAPTGEQK